MAFPPSDPPMVLSELTGTLVSTWSEEWRHETEIAYLLAMPLPKRNIFLDGIAGSTDREERGIKGVRGEAAVAALRTAIERLGEIRRRV